MSRLRRAGAGGGGVPAPRRVAVAEHELVGALVEEAVGGGVRVGHRHGQRLLRARLDRLADLGANGVRVDAEVAQARLLALDRVLLAPLLDLLLGHVLHVVVRGVTVHAHRHRLEQRRAAAVERALARPARGLEHRLGVVAVDADAGEAVGLRALDRVDRELRAGRRRVGVLVVLEDEDDRQPLHAGPVHRLVEVAARGRAVAEPRDRAAALVAQLERHRHPGRDEHHVRQHRDHPDAAEPEVAEVDVAVATAGDPALPAHVLAEDARGRDAADEVRAEVAVQDAQAVLGRHRERRADRDGLLAVAVVEGARDLALAVEVHRALLDAPHQQHVAQEGDSVVERQVLGYGGGVVRSLRPGGAHGHPGLVFPFVVRGPGGIAARGPGSRVAAGVSGPADAPCTDPTLSAGPGVGPRDLRWAPDGRARVDGTASLAPAGRDHVARLPDRARRRHGAAPRAADRRRPGARRVRRRPARRLLQSARGGGRRAAARPVRPPPAAVAAEGDRRRSRRHRADRGGGGGAAGDRHRPPPGARGPRPRLRRPGRRRARVRPRTRAAPLRGQRRAHGHVEAGAGPVPQLRAGSDAAAVVLRLRRHAHAPAGRHRRPRPEPELGARRPGQPGPDRALTRRPDRWRPRGENAAHGAANSPQPSRATAARLQRQRDRLLEDRLHAREELRRRRAAEDAVVAGDRDVHAVAGDDLAVADDRLALHLPDRQDRRLRRVDDRRERRHPVHAEVRDRERRARQLGRADLAVADLLGQRARLLRDLAEALPVGVEDRRDDERALAGDRDADVDAAVELEAAVLVRGVDEREVAQGDRARLDDHVVVGRHRRVLLLGEPLELLAQLDRALHVDVHRQREVRDRRLRLGHPPGDDLLDPRRLLDRDLALALLAGGRLVRLALRRLLARLLLLRRLRLRGLARLRLLGRL